MELRQQYGGGEERSRIRVVQMDNFKVRLDVRRLDGMPNAWVSELWSVKKVDERIEESVLRWLRHTEKMGNTRSAKKK